MAAITPATMVRNSYVTFSPTAWTSAGATYTFDQPVDDKFFIYMEMTSTTSGNDGIFTISAGSTTVAYQRDLGALTVTLTSTATTTPYRALIGPLETARFMGSTGAITITITSSGSPTGFIGVAKMPYVVYS
jgi:hypothetical protein